MRIKQVVFTEKNRCVVEERDLRDTPAENEILVRNVRTLISAGTELAMLTKIHRGFSDPANTYAHYPFYPGYSAVGEIVKAGAHAAAAGLVAGEMVAWEGKHATHGLTSDMISTYLLPRASDDDLEVYTFAALLTTAFTSIHLAPVTPGENVVVVGMGIVGNLTAQLYRAMGAGTVAGADLSPRRLEVARATGAVDLAFDTSQRPLTEWTRDLGSRGAELVVDAVGLSPSISSCLKAVAARGRVVLLGSPREKMEIDPYNDIHSRGVRLIGAHASTVDRAARERDRPLVLGWLRDGCVRVRDLITRHYALHDAPAAFAGLRDKPDVHLGVILTY
jgi:2-desacetyl-2-hydroxyethyl bacteriochlorophyllide A dehydrogenase